MQETAAWCCGDISLAMGPALLSWERCLSLGSGLPPTSWQISLSPRVLHRDPGCYFRGKAATASFLLESSEKHLLWSCDGA